MLKRSVAQCFALGSRRDPTRGVLSWRSYFKMSAMFPQPNWDLSVKVDNATCKSVSLMRTARLIEGASAGTFGLTPPMTRSLEKLYRVIDSEMRSIGAQKITLPCLASVELWKSAGRWDELGAELIRFEDRHQRAHCLAPTHEEAITSLVADFIVSYKHLPLKLYQIGRKFRDEMIPRHGLLRCREFEMKDLYSFDQDLEHAQKTYDQVSEAYSRIFKRLGLDYVRVPASSGAMGGSTSHEFHLLSKAGEDTLCKCASCGRCYNREVAEVVDETRQIFNCSTCKKECNFEDISAIEVAHLFVLGSKYSEALRAKFTGKDGKKLPYVMGCYGIGVTRLLAASIEVLSHNNAIKWPRLLAPHQIFVIPQKKGFKWEEMYKLAENLCTQLEKFSHLKDEIVLDDRVDMDIGLRVKYAKYQGIPHIVIAGRKSLEDPPLYEYIDVYNDRVSFLKDTELMGLFSVLDTIVL